MNMQTVIRLSRSNWAPGTIRVKLYCIYYELNVHETVPHLDVFEQGGSADIVCFFQEAEMTPIRAL